MTDPIGGQVHIANDVLADLAGFTALECYGVVGMASPSLIDGVAQIRNQDVVPLFHTGQRKVTKPLLAAHKHQNLTDGINLDPMPVGQPQSDGLPQTCVPPLGRVTVKGRISDGPGHDLDQSPGRGTIGISNTQVNHGDACSAGLFLGCVDGGKQVWRKFVQTAHGYGLPV